MDNQNNAGQPGEQQVPGQVPGQVQPGEQQPPPVPQPPMPEQLAQAIQTLEQRVQQLGIQAEARRLTDAQRAREAGCKAMSWMPKYSGEGPFRTFRLEYSMWLRVNMIEAIPDEDFKKYTMLSAFTGKAADMVRCLGPEQPIFRELNFIQLSDRVAQIFQPEAESAMARVEFAQRKQSAKENIAVYAEQKIALFHLAYPQGQANYPTLLTEFVK